MKEIFNLLKYSQYTQTTDNPPRMNLQLQRERQKQVTTELRF